MILTGKDLQNVFLEFIHCLSKKFFFDRLKKRVFGTLRSEIMLPKIDLAEHQEYTIWGKRTRN